MCFETCENNILEGNGAEWMIVVPSLAIQTAIFSFTLGTFTYMIFSFTFFFYIFPTQRKRKNSGLASKTKLHAP